MNNNFNKSVLTTRLNAHQKEHRFLLVLTVLLALIQIGGLLYNIFHAFSVPAWIVWFSGLFFLMYGIYNVICEQKAVQYYQSQLKEGE